MNGLAKLMLEEDIKQLESESEKYRSIGEIVELNVAKAFLNPHIPRYIDISIGKNKEKGIPFPHQNPTQFESSLQIIAGIYEIIKIILDEYYTLRKDKSIKCMNVDIDGYSFEIELQK